MWLVVHILLKLVALAVLVVGEVVPARVVSRPWSGEDDPKEGETR